MDTSNKISHRSFIKNSVFGMAGLTAIPEVVTAHTFSGKKTFSTNEKLCLKIATGNILPLDDAGNQQWPQIGDNADFVFLNVSCSAEAVSRIPSVESLIYQGNIVF